jgi:hypothetical protein
VNNNINDRIEIIEGCIAEATFYGDEAEVQRLQYKLTKLKALAEQLGYSQELPIYKLTEVRN